MSAQIHIVSLRLLHMAKSASLLHGLGLCRVAAESKRKRANVIAEIYCRNP